MINRIVFNNIKSVHRQSFIYNNQSITLKSAAYTFNILNINIKLADCNMLPFSLDYVADNYTITSTLQNKKWESYVKQDKKTSNIIIPFILHDEINHNIIKHDDKKIVTINAHKIQFINWSCYFINKNLYVELDEKI
jgi:hypothetical protein